MAFTITYDGNGSDGGSPPVDNSNYNAGDPVTVADIGTIIVKKSMTKTGAVLAYWNTKADGTGTFHGWPQDTSFTMPAGNLTLYAQWFVATDLNNGGATTHYAFSYDESLRASGLEPGRTQTFMANAEGDYAIMANWFKGVTLGSSPINVYVTSLNGGADNTGDIRLMPNTKSPNELRCLLVSEITESFMKSQNKGWGFMPGVNNEESCGEALSLFLTQQFALNQGFPNPYTGFTASTANGWLNSSLPAANPASTRFFKNSDGSIFDFGSRSDYVNSVLPFPGNGPGTGGSMLFIYYLFRQLGFTIEQIIAAAPGYTKNPDGTLKLNAIAPLQGVYKNLTGYDDNPFPLFNRLQDAAYPEGQASSIQGANPDNPWPLPRLGGLTGAVTNADTGGPIDAAVVVIDGPASAGVHAEHLQLTTGPDGSYTTPPLAPGDYTVEGSASDYVPVTITVTVSEGPATIRANVALPERLPVTVQGTVTDRANAPISNVTVTLVGESGPIWQRTTTDSTGAYSLSLDPGQYTGAYGLYAKLEGYVDGYVGLANIPNGATLTEAFVLVAFGTLTGRITDAGATPATPIIGAGVTAGPANATSASGRYTLEQLTPGPATITVTANGFERAGPTTASVPEGATLTQDFALVRASATLTGTISDAENPYPISGALVGVTGATPQESKSDGTYTVEKIPAGSASITIKARGYDTIQFTRVFAAHETITQDFGLYKPLPPGLAR